jgi:ribose transport system permease protein
MNPHNIGEPAFPAPTTSATRARTRLSSLQGQLGSERLRTLAPPLTLVVVLIIMTAGNPSFLSTANLTTLLIQVSALLVMAIGPTFVILMGSIDISFSEVANWVSVVIAVTIVDLGYGSFPLAVLAGAGAGLVNGILVVKGRIPSLVVTLATIGLWGGLAFRLSGGPPVSIQQDREYLEWITGSTAGIPHEAIIAFVVTIVFYLILRYTWFGRSVYAIGAGEEAARMSGVDVERYKILSFMLSGMTAGIAGMILAGRVIAGSPVISTGFLLYVLAAVLVGGTAISGGSGGIIRTVIGAFIVTSLRNGMNVMGLNIYYQQLVLGSILVIAVILTTDRSKLASIK